MNRIDFDRAFPQTPDCVGEAIRLGFLRGARTAARRRRVAGMLSVAGIASVAAWGIAPPNGWIKLIKPHSGALRIR